ncbi:hypothetical protein An01g00520 [Aspergillus niger]|uniref:Uncharacterized protein n=2 Tax=Aspergillus niger TaxID=5061 RepID=A2Q7F6_ASPNC|nr:hypothetical protein An01g00520 [Aspergillus niger]CAK43440.1 hypothetical protein An01g00520 [Aspergillus niger]
MSSSGKDFSYKGSGTNSQVSAIAYRIDGSYYYSNPNGSTYYNNGNGGSTYTPPSGNGGSTGKK